MKEHRPEPHDPSLADRHREPSPGRAAATERLPVQRRSAGSSAVTWATPPSASVAARATEDPFALHLAVQRRGAGPAAAVDVPAVAAAGVAGGGERLPHLDTIQAAFGRHDVSGVRAHVGGAAAEAATAIGASAYATGHDVAFASSPDVETAAHEAAHVVQQRAGVQLKGGVGEAGDRHEQHADEVAAAVVRGQSAEALLDGLAGAGGAAAPAVQRRIRIDSIDDGEPFDHRVDHVASHWGFGPAEKSVYRRWLRDEDDHHYADKPAFQDAVRTVSRQPFGTDIADGYEQPAERVAIFKQALRAGYRVFDTAATYHTLDELWQAATELHIPRDELTIIYKLKPANDTALQHRIGQLEQTPQDQLRDANIRGANNDKVATRLQKASQSMGGDHPDVLMLHDVDADEVTLRSTIVQLASEIRAGRGKRLGVSNVTVFDLEMLRPIAQEAGVPITMVQNRASPFHRDEDVVNYCNEHDIQYLAYGLMGSAQVGACAGVGDEGEGMPTQYLLARHDPRLKALAEESGISEGELLIAWAQARGITPVSFTSRGDQARRNLDRVGTPLSPEISQRLDAMFVTPSEEAQGQVDEMDAGPLKALYQAYVDPTGWSILDELRGAEGGEQLLTDAATAIVDAKPDQEEQAAALRNFALNLVRHVADIQSAIQRMQNERAQAQKRNVKARQEQREEEPVPEVAYASWKAALIPMFQSLAQAAGAPHVFAAFMTWANRSHLAGHTMAHALEAWPEISLTPEPPPVQQPPPQQDQPPLGQVGENVGAQQLGGDVGAQQLGGDVGAQQLGGDVGAQLGGDVGGDQVEAEITVGYDEPLFDEWSFPLDPEDVPGLQAETVVVYQQATYTVVANHAERCQLVLRPGGGEED